LKACAVGPQIIFGFLVFWFLVFSFVLFSAIVRRIQVSFSEYGDNITEDVLRRLLGRLRHFDSGDKSIIRQYRDLFSVIGTHIITEALYGSRLTLVSRIEYPHLIALITSDLFWALWTSNTDSSVNTNFDLDIGASLYGLPFSGKFDADIKTSSQ